LHTCYTSRYKLHVERSQRQTLAWEILGALRALDGTSAWARPMDVGGRDASPHTRILMKMVRRGLVERQRRWSLANARGSRRGSYQYRLTPLGLKLLDATVLTPKESDLLASINEPTRMPGAKRARVLDVYLTSSALRTGMSLARKGYVVLSGLGGRTPKLTEVGTAAVRMGECL